MLMPESLGGLFNAHARIPCGYLMLMLESPGVCLMLMLESPGVCLMLIPESLEGLFNAHARIPWGSV